MELRTISISQESLELDDLEWPVIKELINKIFKNLNIEIRVYRNQDKIKFEQIHKILKYSEQQMNTCFSSEIDILDKRTNQIELRNSDTDTVTVKFKHYQLLNSRCIIETKINDFSVDALIDTGADFCYISEDLCNQLNLNIENYDCDVLVGNNQKLHVLGKVRVNISITNCEYPITCTVVKTLSHSLILGWIGFIKENNGSIDSKEGIFYLKRPTNHLSSFAFIPRSIQIEPFTENIIEVDINETVSSDLLFVKTYEPLFKKTGITIMPGIHEGKKDKNVGKQRQLNLIITNLSSKPVELPKLTIVAELSTVKTIQLSNNEQDSHQVNTTTNLQELSHSDDISDEQAKFKLENDHLTEEQKHRLNDMLHKHNNLFNTKTKQKVASNIYHEIDTEGNKPISNAPNRTAFKEREYIQQQVKEMLESNVIQPSSSPWSSRIVLVKKKDGKLRFCIDYRSLNSTTKKDVYPLPRIDDSLAMLSRGKFFTTLDLWAGYWQIPLAPNSKEKTAFVTDSGLYEFNVMPFGLCNAPATFQRFMDATLAGLKWKNLLVYMDDIIIFSSTFEEHLKDVDEVLNRLRDANVTLNQNKCEFCKEKIHYLGHVISAAGIQPNPEKVASLLKKKSPSNVKELNNWLGISGYYRSFIDNYAKICAPLYALTHTKDKFVWTDKEENIIKYLKNCLSSEPILRHPNFDFPFILRTDASIEGLGATLSQIINSREQVIQYISRSLQPNEKNWSIQQLEALAIIWACETVRAYIIGSKVLIKTDHKSLEWIKQSKIPRLVRWACRLEEFDYEIEYQPGKFNKSADPLSRLVDENKTKLTEQRKYPGLEINYDFTNQELDELNTLEIYKIAGVEKQIFIDQQQLDVNIQTLVKEDKDKNGPLKQIELINGISYKRVKDNLLLLLPKQLVEHVLEQYHDHALGCHRSRDRLYETLRKRFFWPMMFKDIKEYVNSCELCLKIKTRAPIHNGTIKEYDS